MRNGRSLLCQRAQPSVLTQITHGHGTATRRPVAVLRAFTSNIDHLLEGTSTQTIGTSQDLSLLRPPGEFPAESLSKRTLGLMLRNASISEPGDPFWSDLTSDMSRPHVTGCCIDWTAACTSCVFILSACTRKAMVPSQRPNRIFNHQGHQEHQVEPGDFAFLGALGDFVVQIS
jgi:hypothetical protein